MRMLMVFALVIVVIVSGMAAFMHGAHISNVAGMPIVQLSNGNLYISDHGHGDLTPVAGHVLAEKHIYVNGVLHIIYTVSGRNAQTYYLSYSGRIGRRIEVGGEYSDLAVSSKGVFISSSLNHNPWVYYSTGSGWKRQRLSDNWSTVTSVYAGEKVMVAWRGDGALWLSLLGPGGFGAPVKIVEEKYPIRSITLGEHGVSIREEGTHKWYTFRYSSFNYQNWYLQDWDEEPKRGEGKIAHMSGEARAQAEWTYMVYLNGDNNLDSYGQGDINEMKSGYTSSGQVNLIVLYDKSGNGDTKLYRISAGTQTDISGEASSWLNSEMNMGDPQTLIEFAEWTMQNYPAKYYFLDLWDHGGDYDGAMWDDTSGDHLDLTELRTAAKTIYGDMHREIDIWGYDACLMDAGADDYQVKQAAKIIVASEHTEGGDGWDYNALISNLTTNPWQTPEQYAYSHVVHVDDEGNRQGIVTMAAINTTEWDFWLMQAYNELAQAIRQKAGTENSNVKNAMSNAASADGSSWSSGKDVGDFAKQLISTVGDAKIKYWANRLLENISRSVINSYDTDTSGRKISFAETSSTGEVNSNFYIFKETEWDEMLTQVYSTGTDDNNQEPTCQISSPANGASVVHTSTLTVQGTASDPDGTVSKVEVKVDKGDWITASGTDTWSYTIDVSKLSLGKHYVFARAYDGDLYSLYSYTMINVISRTDLPDLTLSSSDISFSDSSPNEGDTITITATIHNVGNNDSHDVNVSFYYDSVSSEHLIDTVGYGDIPQGGSSTQSTTWNTAGFAGTHQIIVYADSTHTISELNEENNTASRSVVVEGFALVMRCENNESSIAPGDSAYYEITVKNTGTVEDTFDLSVINPTSWQASLSKLKVTLNPGASETVELQVHAPQSAGPGDRAYISVKGVSEGNGEKEATVHTITTIVPLILLVDDDEGEGYETYFTQALSARGFDFDTWDVSSSGSPSSQDMSPYRVVIWSTGADYSSTLTSEDQNALESYLDSGGRLYLSSQDLLWDLSGGNDGNVNNEFVNNYLHVTSVTNDVKYTSVQGVSGDPITGDSGTLALNYPYSNYDDEITVDSSGEVIFTNPSSGNPVADRVDSGTYRLVFTAFSFESVENASASAGEKLLGDIVTWLLNGSNSNNPPDVPDAPSGTTNGKVGVEYTYSASTTDPDGDEVKYTFDWGDGTYDTSSYFTSGAVCSMSHSWSKPGEYSVRVRATDSNNEASGWSSALLVRVTTSMEISISTPENGSTVGGIVNISGTASDPNTASFKEIWNLNYGTAIYQGPQAIGDIDGDGKNEMLIGGRDGKLHIYHWNGNTFVEIANITDPSGNGDDPGGYAIGDIDGDGKNEIAIAWDHDFSAFRWNGNTFVQVGNIWDGDGTDNSYDCAIGDYDNDGKNEVILADDPTSGHPEITVLSLNGGAWTEETSWNDASGNLTTPVVKVADVNGDGKNEIVATPGSKAVVLSWNGNSLQPTYLSQSYSSGAYGIAISDFNGDGINDIAIGLDAPTVFAYEWTGTEYRELYNVTWSGESPIIEGLSAGDVDNNGVSDLVAGTNHVHILEWNGTAFYEKYTLDYTNMGELAVTYVGDVTNDGKNEIVAGNVVQDSAGEYHVRVINYTDSLERIEISIDDPSFAHPILANGTHHWFLKYNISSLSPGEHRIYVRAYNGEMYTARWISVDVSESVPEFSAILPMLAVLLAALFAMRKIRER